MSAPSRAKISHNERPIPRDPPVIIAFFPSNNPMTQLYMKMGVLRLTASLTGGLIFAWFNFGRPNLDAFFYFAHQLVNDAPGGVGNGDARRGRAHRRVFRRIV